MQTDIDMRPKSDAEIWKMAKDEYVPDWLGEIARLWDAVGKPLDEDRLAIYQRELAEIPFGLLTKAISRVIREHSYSNVPPVGTVWKALRVELGNPRDVMEAIQEWNERGWQRCVLRFEGVAVETEMV